VEVLLKEVSFQEAINALKSGIPVHWFSQDTKKIVRYTPYHYYNKIDLTIEQMNEGNWAMEGRYH